MNIVLLFIAGLSLAFLGALPLGTVNLAVINNSISNKKKAVKRIAFAAGISEVLIALFAYRYGKAILNFITHNVVLQYAMVVLLFGLGFYFFLKNEKTIKPKKIKISDFGKGFFLGLANPSVWVYWVIAITFLKNYIATISTTHLFFFFSAIYLGKLFALFLYGKAGQKLTTKKSSFKNIIIGSLLMVTATLQLISQIL